MKSMILKSRNRFSDKTMRMKMLHGRWLQFAFGTAIVAPAKPAWRGSAVRKSPKNF